MTKLRNLFVLFVVVFLIIGCAGPQGPEGPQGPIGADGPEGPAGAIVTLSTATMTATIAAVVDPATATATITPAVDPVVDDSVLTGNPAEWQFSISGVRDSIPMTEVDYAKGGFTATWPMLSNLLGGPGKLVVGPDFPQEKIDASNGAIWRSDGLNTYRLSNNDGSLLGCAEGSFIYLAGQEAGVKFETGAEFNYRAPDGSNTHVYVRCPNSDGEQGSDDHGMGDMWVEGYKPNHIAAVHFPGNPAGGFVDDGGAAQALQISQEAESSGSEGALTTYVVTFDINTGAYTVALWDGETMVLIETNWWNPTS